jgi:hypothetical protein
MTIVSSYIATTALGTITMQVLLRSACVLAVSDNATTIHTAYVAYAAYRLVKLRRLCVMRGAVQAYVLNAVTHVMLMDIFGAARV